MRRFLSALVWAVASQGHSRRLVEYCLKLDPANTAALRQLYLMIHPESHLVSKFESGLLLGLESESFAALAERHHGETRAEIFQDLVYFAHCPESMQRPGYFVEVGLGDGVNSSNTYFMEHSLGWRGLLIEPNPTVTEAIRSRRIAPLDPRAAWHTDDEVMEFLAVEGVQLSTLLPFAEDDHHTRTGEIMEVQTVRLETVLKENNAPDAIDFLSVDTEGSEIHVLEGIDFARREFEFICVEHNYVPEKREAVARFLNERGYDPVWPHLSKFDAWFINRKLQKN
ncbi:FkbM family methyltransferase [Pseudovibrio sp. SPO723]|uniref:FkbM family methyltransferase n=1 Tax=Nesiotobacter zosterae TaxID=392721 RepID=UPI0029C31DD1|nr:FkbM family methyltransferase [Pseudovibrio sp. SPO723]MDX5592624.1 FkbM family methyltransferase [Pseudovibrio sp. SPO723]